jgi:hypothetical protein
MKMTVASSSSSFSSHKQIDRPLLALVITLAVLLGAAFWAGFDCEGRPFFSNNFMRFFISKFINFYLIISK